MAVRPPTGGPGGGGFMENEDRDFWKSLLTNRNLRSRFIRELEIQSISSRSAEDLVLRHRDEEMLFRGSESRQNSALSPSW
jgi:hypothetical protein